MAWCKCRESDGGTDAHLREAVADAVGDPAARDLILKEQRPVGGEHPQDALRCEEYVL